MQRWHPNFQHTSTKCDSPLHPTPPPSFSMYLHICKHGPILFAPTKADPSRGEGSHSPSGPSLSLPCRMVTKKKEEGRGRQKSFFSENTILQSASLLMVNVKRKKIFTVSYFGKAYFLRGWTRGFPELSRSLQSHLYIPACGEEHANTFHRFLELRGKTDLDFSAVRALQPKQQQNESGGLVWFQDNCGARAVSKINKHSWQHQSTRLITCCVYPVFRYSVLAMIVVFDMITIIICFLPKQQRHVGLIVWFKEWSPLSRRIRGSWE